jgi:hypothetical protein
MQPVSKLQVVTIFLPSLADIDTFSTQQVKQDARPLQESPCACPVAFAP